MKLAVCISGFMRTYEETAHSLHENLLKPLAEDDEYDIFIYTSTEDDMSSQCLKRSSEAPLKPRTLTKADLEKIQSIYKPKLIAFDSLNEPSGLDRTPMLRRIYECNNLRKKFQVENSIDYDAVIRVRPDTFFTEKIEKEVVKNITDNEIILFKYGCHSGGYYDGFSIAKDSVMNVYSDLYFYSPGIRKRFGDYHVKIEKNLKYYIEANGLDVKLIDYPTYTLRSWGQKYTFFDQDPLTYKFVPGKIHV